MERERSRRSRQSQDPDGPEKAVERKEGGTGKQVYLRTVYPLNPGIPHFIDVPGGW